MVSMSPEEAKLFECLDGLDALVRRRVEAALGHVDTHTATDVSPSDEHP
jgi:hypothetical protein